MTVLAEFRDFFLKLYYNYGGKLLLLRNLLVVNSFGRFLLEMGGYFWVILNSWKKRREFTRSSFYLWIDLCLLHRLVMGWLRFLEAGRKFDCISSPSTVRMEDDKLTILYRIDCSHSRILLFVWFCRPIPFLCMLRKSKVSEWNYQVTIK